MKVEFVINKLDKKLLDFLFPFKSKQIVKKDIRKYCGNIYYNLSLKKKLQLIEYWRKVIT